MRGLRAQSEGAAVAVDTVDAAGEGGAAAAADEDVAAGEWGSAARAGPAVTGASHPSRWPWERGCGSDAPLSIHFMTGSPTRHRSDSRIRPPALAIGSKGLRVGDLECSAVHREHLHVPHYLVGEGGGETVAEMDSHRGGGGMRLKNKRWVEDSTVGTGRRAEEGQSYDWSWPII